MIELVAQGIGTHLWEAVALSRLCSLPLKQLWELSLLGPCQGDQVRHDAKIGQPSRTTSDQPRGLQ